MNTVKVVSDLICPWCYIGKRRLETALSQLPHGTTVSVSWHPFQLNREMPPEGMDRSQYRLLKFGDPDRCEAMDDRLTEVGKSVGIQFRFDLQSNTPNTFEAHRLIWWAGHQGLQDMLVEALFRAYFCEGVNLSRRAELVDVAASAGLKAVIVERFLNSDEGAADVRAEEREIKQLGVSSVPLFIVQESIAVSGAQPPDVLLKALKQARQLQKKQKRAARQRVGSPSRSGAL